VTEGVHKLGEVLRAAREAKGVDLVRVERDTKIRERYLSALERSEYRELPGAVYTKGFLRNYGAYLGLDPEYLIDLYRLESAAATGERPRAPAPPRPLAARRSRAFVVTPGAVVAAILTILVGGFVA
jgi:cytoskeleton protein RodZ